MSANVSDAPLGCVFGWRLRLRRKLKHGCLLALNQACQENTRAIGKFECVMMHLWHHNEAFGAALAKNIRKWMVCCLRRSSGCVTGNYQIDLKTWARCYFYGHKIMGYVLASFLIAELSGLTKY